MSENLLSFEGSNQWREKLVSKNLEPYKIPGVYQAPLNSDAYYETELSTTEVKNSQDVSFEVTKESTQVTVLNKYSTSDVLDGAALIRYPSDSEIEKGAAEEYNPKQTNLDSLNEAFINAVGVVNQYAPEEGYKDLFFVSDNILPKKNFFGAYPNFEPGTYTLSDIILGNSNATDSYLQLLGITFLKDAFQQRIDREIRRGLDNILGLNDLTNPFSIAQIATGKQSLVGKIYTITVPDGVFDQGKFLLSKISGAQLPASPIEGSYFLEPDNRKLSVRQLLEGAFPKFFKPADPEGNPSIKFLNNTGSGQKSVLFASIGYNVFKPPYEENKTQVGLLIDKIFDKSNTLTNFYVGGDVQNPSTINSPVGQTPVNYLGKQTQSIVLGPSNLSKIYESNTINNLKFGLNGEMMTDATLSDGGFVWTQKPLNQNGEPSNTTNPESGKAVGTSIDGGADYNQYGEYTGSVQLLNQSSILTNTGENPDFKLGSILDETQRLIDSAPRSGRERLVHAGNAINQVSKVFMDGYKILTKGSKVRRYQKNTSGTYEEKEFGRVFSKDRPYYFNSQLQKNVATDDGSDTNGNIRKSQFSVLDSTYNLNIAPYRGNDSTNVRDGRVKKYMFSIENLAWRGTPEFEDLPDCEKGPNGGRIMWFPPYNLTFDDSSQPTFNATTFLGRPEPIYTYQNTKRSGTLNWSIIVDHPSVLNLIVDKELKDITSENTANKIVNSFFAGLTKYDLYELAKIYNTVPKSALEEIYQEIIGDPNSPIEDKESAAANLAPTDANIPKTDGYTIQTDCKNIGFYFDDASSTPNLSTTPWDDLFDIYTDDARYNEYLEGNPPKAEQTENFFDYVIFNNYEIVIQLMAEIHSIFDNKIGKVKLVLSSSLYQDSQNYAEVSEQRLESIKQFFATNLFKGKTLADKLESTDFQIVLDQNFEQNVSPKGDYSFDSVNCSQTLDINDKIFSPESMACRALRVKEFIVTEVSPESESSGTIPPPSQEETQQGVKPNPQPDLTSKTKNISKFILRNLLTECNYFEMLRASDPFVFDNIRKKIKYFSPVFHSTTPEGLNGRVTFLNQCTRPGRTIPVKNIQGELETPDAFNTAFGSPPVLVLRVGDYFNTKIIPGNISFKYEALDLNPEGIGVQPMICNVTFSFDIIGGMGLENPINEIQNALTFNYYANTEMYDDRATATEDTTAIDTELLESILTQPDNSLATQQATNGGDFIGKILTQSNLNGKIFGIIEYGTFFNQVVTETQNYFNSVTTFSSDLTDTYNTALLYRITKYRSYTDGYINNIKSPQTYPAQIFGKPSIWQESLNEVNQSLQTKINNGQDPIISGLSQYSISFDNKEQIKQNYINLCVEKITNGFGDIQDKINEIANIEVNYYQTLRKLDFICFSGDGKILGDGSPDVVLLTGQTENSANTLFDISDDYRKIAKDLQNFYNESRLNEIFFDDGDYNLYESFNGLTDGEVLVYTLFSEDILDLDLRYTMMERLIENTIDDGTLTISIDAIVIEILNGLDTKFQQEKADETLFKDTWLNDGFTYYEEYNPQDSTGFALKQKERKMFYSNEDPAPQEYGEELKNIFKTININNDYTTYVGKVKFN
jgi:hypothetical protein